MKNFTAIKETLEKQKAKLKRQFKVKEIALFGSHVRGEQKKNSDVDILVEFSQPISFFEFLDLEEYLGRVLSMKVDLVSKRALKPWIGKRILQEMIRL